MSTRNRSALAVLAIGVMALTGACAQGGGGAPAGSAAPSAAPSGPSAESAPKISIGTAADSNGPAIAPEGGVKGGTAPSIERDDFAHLDPGRIYVNTDSNVSLLFPRQLTGYKRVARNDYKLVG